MNVKYTLYPRCFRAVVAVFLSWFLFTVYNEFSGGFTRHLVCELGAKELKGSQPRLESDVNSTCKSGG